MMLIYFVEPAFAIGDIHCVPLRSNTPARLVTAFPRNVMDSG
jgi:hypothetical protein